jgi:hypothetical protein
MTITAKPLGLILGQPHWQVGEQAVTESELIALRANEKTNKPITTDELVERAASQGIIVSSAAIRADARKLLKRSGIHSPSPEQSAVAERAAVEGYLLAAKATS